MTIRAAWQHILMPAAAFFAVPSIAAPIIDAAAAEAACPAGKVCRGTPGAHRQGAETL